MVRIPPPALWKEEKGRKRGGKGVCMHDACVLGLRRGGKRGGTADLLDEFAVRWRRVLGDARAFVQNGHRPLDRAPIKLMRRARRRKAEVKPKWVGVDGITNGSKNTQASMSTTTTTTTETCLFRKRLFFRQNFPENDAVAAKGFRRGERARAWGGVQVKQTPRPTITKKTNRNQTIKQTITVHYL